MKITPASAVFFTSCLINGLVSAAAMSPDENLVFVEKNGLVAVEAEHFFKQTEDEVRSFHLTHSEMTPGVEPDGDPPHLAGASGGAYLEILPDTRRTHAEKLLKGKNFSPLPGKMAVLHYRVKFERAGRYYVWVRAYSTGTEDNGLHVGINGTWPASGQRLQWCKGKNSWWWESRQRTEKEHCGEPHKIFLDVPHAGTHVIQFSMREDGFEFDKWLMTTDRGLARPQETGPESVGIGSALPQPFPMVKADSVSDRSKTSNPPTVAETSLTAGSPTRPVSSEPLQLPRKPDGDGDIEVSGELKVWHKIMLSLAGPYAHEKDNLPNPFTDYRMTVDFIHTDGTRYQIPGYFAADGNAANTSAESGTVWRACFAPDRIGTWKYHVNFQSGKNIAIGDGVAERMSPFDGTSGEFEVLASDRTGKDFRAHGRLQYVGKRYLQHAGSKRYFLKVGADAPETLLAYRDFDNTVARKKGVPLKDWGPHVTDWKRGDPVWKGSKGKGLIGAVNYLSAKGCNAFSFLTYNAGGDGDNVWPFIDRDDKLHYDCSKLDQWGIVFEHGTRLGMYLHFKMQETENDDHRHKGGKRVPESLDGGDLGLQRKLYCRELISRFGHNLALNWNLGEENTQSSRQQRAMIDYIARLDAYDHNIVVHTYPDQQDQVYRPLLGDESQLTGVSLQNSSLETTHAQTVKWVRESADAGKPWIVAFDESGSAAHAQCPDLGYRGFDGRDRDGKMVYTQHKVRQQTLWGTLMAGGAGNEYYFGYKFDQNDLVCEDWRSRDQSWNYCRIAVNFFHDHQIPFWNMVNTDELVGNPENGATKFCFSEPGSLYLVYLPKGGTTRLDLSATNGSFEVVWFNPRSGGRLQSGTVRTVSGGADVDLGLPPIDHQKDWLVIVRHAR